MVRGKSFPKSVPGKRRFTVVAVGVTSRTKTKDTLGQEYTVRVESVLGLVTLSE